MFFLELQWLSFVVDRIIEGVFDMERRMRLEYRPKLTALDLVEHSLVRASRILLVSLSTFLLRPHWLDSHHLVLPTCS